MAPVNQIDSRAVSAPAQIGILIVGSLLWDPQEHRQRWRSARLDVASGERVCAPIRYGRKSRNRGNSYTMVFSNELDATTKKLGFGIAVPCKAKVGSAQDLIEEAEALWRAERGVGPCRGEICAGWGSVALITNPEFPIGSDIVAGWSDKVASQIQYGGLACARHEKPAVSSDGFMNISWPHDAPSDWSAMLATATNPTIYQGRYPSVSKIAEAWHTDDGFPHRDYFTRNRERRIETFQDEEILEMLGGTSD